jgi:hypothetical protein
LIKKPTPGDLLLAKYVGETPPTGWNVLDEKMCYRICDGTEKAGAWRLVFVDQGDDHEQERNGG